MARRPVLVIVAVLIALVGTALIVMYVQGIEKTATEGQELVEVLVATEQIDTGETIEAAQEAGKIDTKSVRRDDVVEGALGSTKDVAGDLATGTIYPGEQLIASKFGTLDGSASLSIPEDMMAVSVELTDFERVAGFVNPGNEVAVFATTNSASLIRPDDSEKRLPATTRIVLPRSLVLGVGTTSVSSRTTTDEDGGTATEEVARTILTLAVSQEEAEKLILADRTSDLNFALLTDESKTEDNEGKYPADVFPELYKRGLAGL